MGRIGYILIIYMAFAFGCRKPYAPQIVATNGNYLVVEGLINTGTDSTIINLSRTVVINSKNTANPETKAIITVENAQGTAYPLKELGNGKYAAAPLGLDNTKQYRIRVKTSNGKTYLSDLVDSRIAPPIDSVGFKIITTGDAAVQIYVNAHDATSNTRYYKYNFQETWQFHAEYASNYITNGTAIVPRTNQIYACYGSDFSSNTLVNSTAALSQDVVFQFPVTTILSSSEKIETKYSILLQQQAITKEAYEFWENLKKNTEDLGSIFDAQPSQLIGNIHNIANPDEPVIGYISAGTVQTKRIFITRAQLPQQWQVIYPFSCGLDSAYYMRPPSKIDEVQAKLIPLTSGTIITDPFYSIFLSTISSKTPMGYLYTVPACGDCTIRGFTQTPSYWK